MKNGTEKLRCILLLLIMYISGAASAMADIVTGTVVDDTGEPLIGVTVQEKGNTNNGVATGLDGDFKINVRSPKSTLIVSYVGMKTQEVALNGRQSLKVTLESDSEVLDEVVVVGYGQQKKVSVVGAITQATGETLAKTGGVSSIGAALTGNLPGVVTMQSSGMPGDEDPKIVIRGQTSWNSSDPLVLVDGIERPMSSVDIGSVQSVSVLKDASATAVYGV
ncbi:MAG: carboxypeptidase-like regulatory domain-containing protein, partial [Duncaniella sp.]|nr:carboxypeptidase-like regulatory domain-containing protein [Duncaniella sp.]